MPNKQKEIFNKCFVIVISRKVLHTKKPILLISGYKSTDFSVPKDNWCSIKKKNPSNQPMEKPHQIFTVNKQKKALKLKLKILNYFLNNLFHLTRFRLSEVKVKLKLLSRVRLFATPWTIVYQAPPSMGFSRQEYWSGLPFPSPGDLPDPGIEPRSPTL